MSSTTWPPDDAQAFWDWSCGRYARPGVAPACLELQDAHGLQVNLLLLGCWLAACGRAVAAGHAARIAAAAGGWQAAAVRPLRETRRRLKRLAAEAPEPRRDQIEALRRQVAAAELAAERIEQLELQRLAGPCPLGSGTVHQLAWANVGALLPLAANAPGLAGAISRLLEAH